jgi:hypothetical protein
MQPIPETAANSNYCYTAAAKLFNMLLNIRDVARPESNERIADPCCRSAPTR